MKLPLIIKGAQYFDVDAIVIPHYNGRAELRKAEALLTHLEA